jgi:putative DNA primase/helicase
MSADVSNIADDFQFCDAWFALPQHEKDALPNDVKTRCIERYRRLHSYVSESVSRAEPAALKATTGRKSMTLAYRCMSDVQAKPINWLWPGRIARGKVSMLAGNPGLGKSQVTASMAAIVTTGGTWPVDRTRCDRGAVVFLSAEDDAEDTIRPRLEAAEADLTRAFILDAVVEAYRADGGEIRRAFNLKTDLVRLSKMLDEIGEVALIVVDPITAYLGDADSHKNAEVRALLSPLSDLAAKHHAAVVCVSHLNKGGSNDALMRVTGSLAFVAAARAAWLVARDQENANRVLFLPLKNNNNDQTGLAFAVQSAQVRSDAGLIETSCVAWEAEAVTMTADEAMTPQGDPEERSAVGDAKNFLRGLLADGAISAKRVYAEAREAGYSERTMRRAQKALSVEAVKDGLKAGWSWRLPSKAAKFPEDGHTKSVAAFGRLQPAHRLRWRSKYDPGNDHQTGPSGRRNAGIVTYRNHQGGR